MYGLWKTLVEIMVFILGDTPIVKTTHAHVFWMECHSLQKMGAWVVLTIGVSLKKTMGRDTLKKNALMCWSFVLGEICG